LKQRGHFDTVQFLTEDVTGHREWFENDCSNAPAAATDPEVLAGLASDTALDFAEGGVVRFCVANSRAE
jgi:hypothetical protein